MNNKTFTAVLNKEEDMFVTECPEVGTVSQGYTMEEALGIYVKQWNCIGKNLFSTKL